MLVFRPLKVQFLPFLPNSFAFCLRLNSELKKYQAMKNHIFVLLAALGLLTACDKADEATVQPLALEGTWHLKEVVCMCEPVDLERGQHEWVFDASAGTVNVRSTVDEESLAYVPKSGTYPFTVDTATETVTVENTVFNEAGSITITFDYSFEDEDLILSDNPEVDGPWIRFVR